MTRWLRQREHGYVTSLATLSVLAGFYAVVSQFLPPPTGEESAPSFPLLVAGLVLGALGAAALVTRHRSGNVPMSPTSKPSG
jgi:hypothetical protein